VSGQVKRPNAYGPLAPQAVKEAGSSLLVASPNPLPSPMAVFLLLEDFLSHFNLELLW
jgi:hypothetical protein